MTEMTTGRLEAELAQSGTTFLPVSAEEQERARAAFAMFASGVDGAAPMEIVRIIAGHINVTYGVRRMDTGEKFVLQRLNTIFDAAAIDNNLQLLEQAQALHAAELPAHWQPVRYLDVPATGGKIYYDPAGQAWRVMCYVPGDIRIFNTFGAVPAEMKCWVARALGEAIAIFGRMLDAIPEARWQSPLPNFHTMPYHLAYLDTVLRGERVQLSLSTDATRIVQAQPEILARYAARITALRAQVDARRGLVTCLDALGHGVAHGDTKINNFVFRADPDGTLRCACLIDLDTVQLGNRLDDLGDALRSAGNPAGEEPPSIDDVAIDTEIVRMITEGYLDRVRADYGEARARELAASAIDAYKVYLYSQCARFFADALVGNEYFKLKAGLPEDINLYRAEVQMRALEALEAIDPACVGV